MAAAALNPSFLRSPPPHPFFSPNSTTTTSTTTWAVSVSVSVSLPPSARLHLLQLRRHRCTIYSTKKSSASIALFSSWSLLFLRELHLDDKEAEGLLQRHPALELASPDSLRSRVLSLQSLGITGLALQRAVIRCPDVLTSTGFEEFLRFAQLELKKLKPRKLERLLATTQPDLLAGIVKGVEFLVDHGIPRSEIGHLVNNVNISKVFCERPQRELEEMVNVLKGYCWPKLILRRPALLNLDLHSQLIPRMEFFNEVAGGDQEAAASLIGKLPALLSYTVEHYQSQMEFWRSVGLTNKEVFRIALVYPNIFSVGLGKLKPRIELLKQCGLDAEDIFKFLTKAPLYASLSLEENLAKKLAFLVKIGYKHRTRELAFALGATTRTSCKNMQMVLSLFFSYGLTCEEVLAMSKKHPQVLQYNHQSLAEKLEFLIEGMERDIEEILVFPAFLGYKLDDRIKKRYEMKKYTRGKDMSLNKLLSVSTKKFYLNKTSSEDSQILILMSN